MNLRPHHLLCIQKYTGHGYDAPFTANMNSIVSELANRPMTQINITAGCDLLCTKCPNNVRGTCISRDKVAAMDRAVLNICGLAYGESIPWADLAFKARKGIFETDKFHEICSNCQWYDLCRNTENHNE